jgi:hypothetical protein
LETSQIKRFSVYSIDHCGGFLMVKTLMFDANCDSENFLKI